MKNFFLTLNTRPKVKASALQLVVRASALQLDVPARSSPSRTQSAFALTTGHSRFRTHDEPTLLDPRLLKWETYLITVPYSLTGLL